MTTRSLAIAALVLVCATSALSAAELATDAERTYGELRVAKDAKSKLMADRWYNLIRLQEWNDLSGKFSTTAKYVEHDPDLAWVKLRVIKGTGANRVVKDLTIPVAKLSKTCQSRVRQISVLREKVIAAAAEAGKEKEVDENADAAGEIDAGRGEEPPPREEIALDQPGDDLGRGRRGEPLPVAEPAAAPPPEASAPMDRTPLARQLPPLPTPATSPAGVVPVADDREQGASIPAVSPTDDRATAAAVAPANLPDDAPWRTSYDAFRANFGMDTSQRMPQPKWGSLDALKQANDVITKWREYGSADEAALQEIKTAFAAVGEFTWEATLVEADASAGDWTARLNLPPLPEPFQIRFVLDPTLPAENWQRLENGDPVRFAGRFDDVVGGTILVALIRFPEPAAVAPVVDDRARGAMPPAAPPTNDRATAKVVAPVNLPDDAPWRTSFDAFRANFRWDRSREIPGVDWGSLEALKQANIRTFRFRESGSDDERERREIDEALAAVGEFVWESTCGDDLSAEGENDLTARINLPSLPDPMYLSFVIDTDRGAKMPPNLKEGDRVRFAGRFIDIEDGDTIVAAIRFLEAPAPSAATDASIGGAELTAPSAEVAPAKMPDNEPWRTNYESFRANIKPTTVLGLPTYDFGPMRDLKTAFDTMSSYDSVGDEENAEIDRHLVAAGEVQWEATLAGTGDRDGDWTEALGLPPAEEFDLAFVLDPDQDPGPWRQLKTGDHVRFIGRFHWFHDSYGLTIAIRFLEPSATAAPAADGANLSR